MAHVGPVVGQREGLDRERPERVPKVVEPEALQSRASQRTVEALSKLPVVDRLPDLVHEDEVLSAREARPAAQLVEGSRRLVDQRHAAHSAGLRRALNAPRDTSTNVDESLQEVHVLPAGGG